MQNMNPNLCPHDVMRPESGGGEGGGGGDLFTASIILEFVDKALDGWGGGKKREKSNVEKIFVIYSTV